MARLNLLLDTHILLWWLTDSRKLNKKARTLIENAQSIWVSAVSAWEIESKRSQGLLDAPADLEAVIAGNGFCALAMTIPHAITAGRLPLHHRDPFDRLLVAQASEEQLTLLTHDGMLARYQVPILVV